MALRNPELARLACLRAMVLSLFYHYGQDRCVEITPKKSTQFGELRDYPCMVVSDNGTELTSNAMLRWQEDPKVGWPAHIPAPALDAFADASTGLGPCMTPCRPLRNSMKSPDPMISIAPAMLIVSTVSPNSAMPKSAPQIRRV
ncbi:hypothetical protein [uncultured Roseobacter sp.]|uniref:hypothetical protein n=1 Tax=uncultured Roseobacter sp. TaxID=114847 RepID=UPI00261F5533|nr:hypothetical protein [uncultured Roseobacter sp.]